MDDLKIRVYDEDLKVDYDGQPIPGPVGPPGPPGPQGIPGPEGPEGGMGAFQPIDDTLTSLAGLSSSADQLPYFVAPEAFGLTPFTPFARTLLDDIDAGEARTTLELGSMATESLADYAKLGEANVFTKEQTIVDQGILAPYTYTLTLQSAEATGYGFPSLQFYSASASPAADDWLGGIDFIGRRSDASDGPYAGIWALIVDPTLASRSGMLIFQTASGGGYGVPMSLNRGVLIASAAGGDKGWGTLNAEGLYENGVALSAKYFVASGISAYGATLIDDADAATARGTLGLGTIATQNANAVAFTGGTWSSVSTGAIDGCITLRRDFVGMTIPLYITNFATPTVGNAALIDFSLAAGNNLRSAQIGAVAKDTGTTHYFVVKTSIGDVPTERLFVGGGLVVGLLGIGADKGHGTINVPTIYENGVALGSTYAKLGAANTFTAFQTITGVGQNSLMLECTDPGAGTGPILLMRRTSASPVANDALGQIIFQGMISTAVSQNYADIYTSVSDPIAGSEDAKMFFRGMVAGAYPVWLTLGPGVSVGSAADMGINTLNAPTIYENGVAISTKYYVASGISAYMATVLDDADAATARGTLGLGTAAVKNTGTSGSNVPLLDGANTWSAAQTITLATASALPLVLISTDAGAAAGPYLDIQRDSASPAASDLIGVIRFMGRDSANVSSSYATLDAMIIDPNNVSGDSRLYIKTKVANALTAIATFEQGVLIGAATGGDKGVGTLNAVTLYQNGTALGTMAIQNASAVAITGGTWVATAAADGAITLGRSLVGVVVPLYITNTATATTGNAALMDFSHTNQNNVRGVQIGDFAKSASADHAFVVRTSSNAGVVPTERLYVSLGLVVGAPTSGDKGIGMINAVSVYDDNVLLTCLPLQREFLNKGKVDLAKWDKLAAKGRDHEAAHYFVKLLDEGIDPRNPKKFIEAIRKREALPGMPSWDDWKHGALSTGEMINRLWLTIEMLATAWMTALEKPYAK